MTDQTPPPADAQANSYQIGIQKLYIKDLSFETTNSPMIFTVEWKPEVNLQIGTEARALGERLYEVVLTLTVTAKVGEKSAYLAEVQQAGLFTLGGFAEQELAAVLNTYCPNVLFAFGREVVADIVGKGGFAPIYLAPVNFELLYLQHQQRQQQASSTAAAPTEGLPPFEIAAPTEPH